MSRKALMRLIRVAEIMVKDNNNRDTVARAQEIISLARLIEKELPNDPD